MTEGRCYYNFYNTSNVILQPILDQDTKLPPGDALEAVSAHMLAR